MDPEVVLAAYDEQLRAHLPEDSTARIERTDRVVRQVADSEHGWSGIVWSRLTEDDADEQIAAQRDHFAALGRRFEWKHYAHDRPADLPDRLRAAGFEPEPDEALMVAEVAELPKDVELPEGVRLEQVSGAAGIAAMVHVHGEAFGADHPGLSERIGAQLADAPDELVAIVLWHGDRPVSAGRLELPPGVDFASVWGGGTVADWRGRGLYRALIAYRAGIAARRGYRWLQVDAGPQSEPILARLGFARLSTTRPYVWQP